MNPLAIVFFADALSAIEVCWSLSNANFSVLALRKRGRACPLRYSRVVETATVPAPEEDLPHCTGQINKLVYELTNANPSREIVLTPLEDEAVLLCNALTLPNTVKTASPPPSIANIALDKWQQIKLAAESGFNVIETAIITPDTQLESHPVPCILKPRFAIEERDGQIAKREFYACPDSASLKEAAHKVANEQSHISQPFIAGVGEGIFGFANHNKVQVLSAHRRIRMMNPEGSGSSACENIPVTPELERAAVSFVSSAKWTGLFMVELMRDSNGKVWFMEFNGRPWGSTALARRVGLEYPAWHARAALGKKLPEIEKPPFSATICRHIGREIIHFLFVLRGPRKTTNTVWPKVDSTLINLLTPRVNQYWYNFRWSDPLPFIVDTIWTVANMVFKKKP